MTSAPPKSADNAQCDFCPSSLPIWSFSARDFVVLLERDGELQEEHLYAGAWFACEACHDLIEAEEWDALVDRACPDNAQVRVATKVLFEAFKMNRDGKAVHLSPGHRRYREEEQAQRLEEQERWRQEETARAEARRNARREQVERRSQEEREAAKRHSEALITSMAAVVKAKDPQDKTEALHAYRRLAVELGDDDGAVWAKAQLKQLRS